MRRVGHAAALGLLVLIVACSPPADTHADASTGAGDDASSTPTTAPRRIVSLIPGVNRVLVDLGAGDLLVGRTDYDTLYALADLPSVGGGIGPDLETLVALRPDLVIRFDGAQDARTAERLDQLGIPHIGFRTDGIDDVRAIALELGETLGMQASAARMVSGIDEGLAEVTASVADLDVPRVVWILGGTPPLVAGPGTFLQELVVRTGGENVFPDLPGLYTPVSLETLLTRDIDVIVASEGTEIDPRISDGRRVAFVPSHVEIPGPDIVTNAWIVAMALHPDLDSPLGRDLR